MRIAINLATRPYADLGPALKRLRVAIAALLVVALGLGLGLRAFHQKAEEARAREHSLDLQIARIAQERQGYQDLMRQPANAQLLVQAGALNRLFDEKTFSWTLAMEDLETVLPGGVQVSNLEPVRNTKNDVITLHLRVVGPRDRAVDLVENLEHSKHFLLPRIVGESTESSGGPGEKLEPVSASNRVNFDLLADYNSAAPIERRMEKKHEEEPGGATGAHAGQAAPLPHGTRPLAAPPASGQRPARPPYTGAGRPKPNPGGPQ
jgi:type IV pilus assembly protein PilN